MKRFLLSLCAVILFAIAPAESKLYRDANWVAAESEALDTQHQAYSAAKESGHEAMANGDYVLASEFYIEAAENAIWSWTQGWQLNNAAFAILKSVNDEDGLSSAERADLERALLIYEASLNASDYAKDAGESLDEMAECESTVRVSGTALLRTLGR